MDRRQRFFRERKRRDHRRLSRSPQDLAAAWSIAFALATLSIASANSAEIALSDRKSGYEFMSAQTQAMQDDDAANPEQDHVRQSQAQVQTFPSPLLHRIAHGREHTLRARRFD